MAAIIPGLENINWFPIIGQFIYWLTIIISGIIIIAGFWFVWYTTQFKIKATVIPIYGSGKDGVFSIGAPKYNRIKWINNKTAWKSMRPWFNKTEREPFDDEYIYPGNRIWTFELNNQWMPGRININQTEEEIRSQINPVPYYVRNWQSIQHKKNAEEFAKQGFWNENKTLIMIILTAFACTAMVTAVIYFTYKFAAGGRADIGMLTNAIQGLQNIPGNVPR
jgi:hypothetical protein